MSSVLAVLVLIVGIINIVNYVNVINGADNIVSLLKDSGGKFEIDDEGHGENGEGDGNEPPREDDGRPHGPMSPETPFETRYFTVEFDVDGDIRFVNTDRIAAIDITQAVNYAVSLYMENKTSGFCDNYRYGVSNTPNGTMYIFVDCTRELNNFKTFLLISIIVGISAFIVLFILVFFLSGKVMKPVAESYDKQKRFITDASHEIKTPLTVIGANIEVLEMQGVQNKWTDSVKEQVKRLTSLTEKLVFLARMDEESQSVKVTDFSISDAVEETVKPFSAVAVSNGLSIDCDVQKNITFSGDESMIRQLVSILVDNAIKYCDERGKVSVTLKNIGGKIRLSVSNPAQDLNGDLNLLFERFYRADKSRNSTTGGHGIGLSVAKAIVAAHKGKITAKGENGIAIFTVIF